MDRSADGHVIKAAGQVSRWTNQQSGQVNEQVRKLIGQHTDRSEDEPAKDMLSK
jgi:hypothetical protein